MEEEPSLGMFWSVGEALICLFFDTEGKKHLHLKLHTNQNEINVNVITVNEADDLQRFYLSFNCL